MKTIYKPSLLLSTIEECMFEARSLVIEKHEDGCENFSFEDAMNCLNKQTQMRDEIHKEMTKTEPCRHKIYQLSIKIIRGCDLIHETIS